MTSDSKIMTKHQSYKCSQFCPEWRARVSLHANDINDFIAEVDRKNSRVGQEQDTDLAGKEARNDPAARLADASHRTGGCHLLVWFFPRRGGHSNGLSIPPN